MDKSSNYIANKYGLNTPSCLTPLVTWNSSDKCLTHFMCIVCSLYQCFSNRTKDIGTFRWINFSNNFMCNTLSNAFGSSKNTACTDEPWVTTGVGNLRPAGRIRPAVPLANCSNCMARLVAVYFMNRPPCNFFHWILTRNYLLETALCYKCTVCRILGFRYERWKSGVNLIKLP